MVLSPADLRRIPPISTESYWYWTESSKKALRSLLRPLALQAVEDGGAIRILSTDQTLDDLPSAASFTISAETGMLGTPKPTDDGVEVTSLLLPQIALASPVTLTSSAISGSWNVYSIRHKGINRVPGEFNTTLDLRQSE